MGNVTYHYFQIDNKNFIYLTDYKQLFNITDKEIEIFQKDPNQFIKNNFLPNLNEIDINSLSTNHEFNDSISLFLNIANFCNAKCVYCFANGGNYRKDEGLMSFDVAQQAIDYFLKNIVDNQICNIIFFGGEPLLAKDIIVKLCYYIEKYYDQSKINFHVVTNGTLIDEDLIEIFNKFNFSIGMSIDGNEEIHNKQRPLNNGKNSFNEATKYLNSLFNKIKRIHARGTYYDFSYSLVKIYNDLFSLGFNEISVPPDLLNNSNEKDIDLLINQLDDLYFYSKDFMSREKDIYIGLIRTKIRSIFSPLNKDIKLCGAGKNIYSVDFTGSIYPCHRFCSIDSAKIGNISNGIISHKDDILRNLCKNNEKLNQCNSCWNKYTCDHGCAYNEYSPYDDFKSPNYCRYSKKMTELTLGLISNLDEQTLENILFL